MREEGVVIRTAVAAVSASEQLGLGCFPGNVCEALHTVEEEGSACGE